MKEGKKYRSLIALTAIFVLFVFAGNSVKGSVLLPGEDQYAIVVEQAPSPVGGLVAIMKKITYPDMAIKTRTEGKVYVLAFINESGDVDEVRVVKGIGAGCDEEAAKAVKKTKFTPGVDKGVNVKTKLALALAFKLE